MNKPNLEKLQKQLDQIKNPRSSSSNDDNLFWRLTEGDHQIRLLALENGDIMRNFHWHYGVNGKNYLCAKQSFNKECPICDLASNIWNEFTATRDNGTPDDSLKEAAKELFASKRFYFPVLVRGMEDEGPKVYSAGSRAAEQIFQIATDPENEEMFDPQKGFDLKVTYKLQNPDDRRTASTTINASRKTSPLLEGASKEELEEFYASIPDFDELFNIPDPNDIRSELDSYIAQMSGVVSDDVGTEQYSDSPVQAAFERLQAD